MLMTTPTRLRLLALAGLLGLSGIGYSLLAHPTYGLPPMAARMLDPEVPRTEATAIAHDCLQAHPADLTALMLCVDYRSESWRVRYDPDWLRVRHGPARP